MPVEPQTKRAVSFFNSQNLFRHAKDAFGHYHPNYDPEKLAAAVFMVRGWVVASVHFYTGVPDAERSPMWPDYWTGRLTATRRVGIVVTSQRRRYRIQRVRLRDGTRHDVPVQREKGIDLWLGLDVVRIARNAQCGGDLQSGPGSGRSGA